ncbi:FkbM family methyltransferase [Candidatus Binatus sp.]|uniref:FkbM family methyltransferase n=1 Tax=Candidatus Binatus sp. TaxID=2811406 RepID=UPI003BAF1680
MNILERAGVAIRHAPALERADWLWDRIRPAYDRVLATVARGRGLERVINGTDRFRLSAQSRGFIAEKYEPAVWGRVMREVRAGDHIAEVGASVGLYALAFARRVGDAGQVTAFEPDPESASALEANVGVNGWQDKVTVIRAAVGQSSRQVRFASARGQESRIETRPEISDGVITVPMVTLDAALARQRVDVVKIDVEGFEQQVLQGARTILTDQRRRPRAILVEVHPFAWVDAGTTSASFLGLMDEMGFRVEDMQGGAVSSIEEYGHVIALRK